ncbi:Outer membrane protein OprJ [Tepidimonas sediminis]|uniref:Outer membrane protein OprJ n=1 Tax=Tepidimonas sediminis TaxID=2588941 RepID=A0A554WR83_9BURK|nr:TolC family protein [Tepidimonas sediminis]TSE26075.1 Outer membrane protein OprJ [Tepidimonas sediminis]
MMHSRMIRFGCRYGWSVSALLLVAWALGGCATPPRSAAPEPALSLPAAWSAADEGVLPGPALAAENWWQGFGDAALNAWVQAALQANADVRSAAAALAQARAARQAAQAALSPTLDAGVRARRQATEAASGNLFGAGLDASWELDLWGRRAAAVQAAQADAQASAATLAWTRVSLAAEVALAYFDGWSARERSELAARSLAAQEDSVRLTAWRVQAGLVPQQDLDTARASLEQTRASLAALRAAQRQALHALVLLAGRAPGQVLAEPRREPPEPPPAWALPLPAQLLTQRPDVAAAQARLQAAAARLRQAEAARWPTLTLTGSLSWQAPRVTDLFDPAALTRSLAAALLAPVIDGGLRLAQQRQQEAAVEQARAALEGALLAALRDVENALVAIAAERARVQHLRAAEAAAEAALRQATQRHQAGLTDLRVLLEAQRTWLTVGSERVAAQAQLAAAYVRLAKALGGGWTPQAEADTVAANPKQD